MKPCVSITHGIRDLTNPDPKLLFFGSKTTNELIHYGLIGYLYALYREMIELIPWEGLIERARAPKMLLKNGFLLNHKYYTIYTITFLLENGFF
jgi:hypothetical protein